MDENLIIEVWDTFKEYIPDKNKGTAANQYIDFLVGNDIDNDTLEGYLGYDPYLDDAINLVLDNDDGFESDEEEDLNFSDEEDY